MSPAAKRARLLETKDTASEKHNDDFDEFDIPEEDLLHAVQNAETEKNNRLSSLEKSHASQSVTDKHFPMKDSHQKPATGNANSFPPTPPSSSPNTDLGKVNRSIPPAPTYDQPYSGTADDPLALERITMNKEWFDRLKPAMQKDTFTKLKQFLDAEKRAGKTIYPPAHLIHSWSRTTPLENVKVVILGQDPYHQPGQACGHSFSVPMGKAVPASLQNIYKELKAEFPSFVPPKHGSFTQCLSGGFDNDLLQTVTAGNAGSHHNRGWEPFTREILKAVAKHAAGSDSKSTGGPLDAMLQGKQPKQSSGHPVVFLAWGQPAARSLAEAGISEKTPNVLILRSPHPSPLSAHRGFLGNGHFAKANEWLESRSRYGPGGGIRWDAL